MSQNSIVKTGRICAKAGEYVSKKDGQTKGEWRRVGSLFHWSDGGVSIKLESVPLIPNFDGFCSVFYDDETQQNEQQGQQQGYQNQNAPQQGYQGDPGYGHQSASQGGYQSRRG